MEENNMKEVLDYIINKRNTKKSFFEVISFNDKNKDLNKNLPISYFSNNGNVESLISNIKTKNKEGWGVFINFNPLNKEKRGNDFIDRINFIFIDLDNAKKEDFEKVKLFLDENNILYSYIAESGNGYHILIDVEWKVENQQTVKDFIYFLYNNISNTVDKGVNDLARIFRIPESFHYKKDKFQLKTLYFKELTKEEIKISNKNIIKIINQKEMKKESSWEEIINKNKSLKTLFNTPIEKGSRSEVELSLIDKLLMKGFIDFELIDEIMSSCKIGKWQSATMNYKRGTYKKALKNYDNHIKSLKKENNRGKSKIKDLLSNEKNKIDRIGTGIHNNVFYFGNSVRKESSDELIDILITSDRDIHTVWSKENDEIRDKFKLSYRNKFDIGVINNPWSNQSIDKYLDEDYEPINIRELFEEIKRLNTLYVYHEDQRVHSVIAADIISNYSCPIFNAKGRMYFQAEHGSGKSTQAKIYSLLTYNAIHGDITPASMERVVESTCGTLVIDNYDNLSEDKKIAGRQFIEVFYKKGSKSYKADGKNHRVNSYNGYSPVVINNIIGLPEVTESRCIKINMIKTNNPKISRKKIKETDKIWQDIVDDLHIWTLDNWKLIEKTYDESYFKDFNNRDLENVESILTIAKIIGEDVFEEINDFLKDNVNKQKESNIEDNWDFIALKSIYELSKNSSSNKCTLGVKEITSYAINNSDYLEYHTDKAAFNVHLGKRLFTNHSQIFKKKRSGGYTYYTFTKEELLKLILKKEFDKYLTVEDVEGGEVKEVSKSNKIARDNGDNNQGKNISTLSTNNTNTTNSTNTTLSTKEILVDLFNNKKLLKIEDIKDLIPHYCENINETLYDLKNEGVIFEPRKGEYKLLE